MKERLDRFFTSTAWLDKVLYLAIKVVHQASSDHDAVLLDTLGCRSREDITDLRLSFRFEACWENEEEVHEIIDKAWRTHDKDVLEKIEKVRLCLNEWQHDRLRRNRSRICRLTEGIDRLVNAPLSESNTKMLCVARYKLVLLYAKKEHY